MALQGSQTRVAGLRVARRAGGTVKDCALKGKGGVCSEGPRARMPVPDLVLSVKKIIYTITYIIYI